jgi:hypothetical protein
MFTVELYARIRRAVMVEELHYILLVVIKAELGLFLPTLALNKVPLNKLSWIRQSEFLRTGSRHSLQMVGNPWTEFAKDVAALAATNTTLLKAA